MTTYNHAYSLSFSISNSNHETGDDITPQQARESIIKRLATMDDIELMECLGYPYDTFEE